MVIPSLIAILSSYSSQTIKHKLNNELLHIITKQREWNILIKSHSDN